MRRINDDIPHGAMLNGTVPNSPCTGTANHAEGTPPATGMRLLLPPREAAAALAMSERWLWEATKAGKIPCVRCGRSVRYDPRDLQAWIDKQKTTQPE